MQTDVTFVSDGLRLAGVLHAPEGLRPGERRPAFVITHGFGGHKHGGQQLWSSRQFAEWGYVTLRFDFRGCGRSEGEWGRVIPLDEVADTRAAIDYLSKLDTVDPDRIGLIGSSYGAAVALYTAGVDKRVTGVISQGGWGDGAEKARQQHPTKEAWAAFTAMVEDGKRHHAETGEWKRVPRFSVVPVPERLRHNFDALSVMEFSVETPIATMDFRPLDVIADIAPRPILLLHSATDGVTPPGESLRLFAAAGEPADLHILSGVDHWMFAENNPRVVRLVEDWVRKFLPVG